MEIISPFPAIEMDFIWGSIKLKMHIEYFLRILAKWIYSETHLAFLQASIHYVDPNISEENYRMIKGR
jgi:hypothetical protein